MILKKQEKDDKVKAIYSSSNICASTYDKTNKTLTIIFNHGGQYQYDNVSETDYMRFEIADSQGKVLNSHIKQHATTKLDAVDTKAILAEVTNIQAEVEQVKIAHAVRQMVDKLKAVTIYYDTTTNVESGLLAKAKEAIANYEAVIESKLDTVNG